MLKIHTILLMPEITSEEARRAVEFYYGVPDTTLRRVNAFLLEGEELVLIDSGYEESVDMLSNRLRELGFDLNDISMIVNTHEHVDHFGGNAEIKERSEAKIAAHEIAAHLIENVRRLSTSEERLKEVPEELAALIKWRDSFYAKTKTASVDIKLKDGNRIDVNGFSLKVLHTPGHTPGHICLYEARSGTLFAGDMITTKSTPFVGASLGNVGDFMNSLLRLRRLKIARAFASHDGEVKSVRRRIDEILDQKLARERMLLDALRGGRKELLDLSSLLYSEGSSYVALESTLAYLKKLQGENKVKTSREGKKLFFSLSRC